MPPRKSTSSDVQPAIAPAPTSTDAGDLSTLSLPADLQDPDVSMMSTTSPSSKVPKGKGPSKEKDKADGDPASEKDKEKEKDGVGIDDLLLPRTLLSRLARGVLPPNTSISKDALLALTKASSVFISHLASTADMLTSKKTIAPQDVLNALEEIEWGNLRGKCEGELKIYEDVSKNKRKGYRDRVKARESGVSVAASQTAEGDDGEGEGEGERSGKRPRVDDETALLENGGQPSNSTSLSHPNGTRADHPMNDGDTEAEEDQDHPEDQPEGQDDTEEDPEIQSSSDEEEEQPEARNGIDYDEEDDLDGYGPDDQLRRDILNGGGGGGVDSEGEGGDSD